MPIGKGSNRLVYLAAPVKDPTGANVQLIIGGLSEDPGYAPGPFGVYLPTTTHTMQRSTTIGAAPAMEVQDWAFAAASGEHLEMHIKFEKASPINPIRPTRGSILQRFPFFQISQEQVLDILKNVTTNPPDA